MPDERACDFYGCSDPVCPASMAMANPKDQRSMRFCQKHLDEFMGYVREENIKAMMSFWVRSHGGARRMMGEEAANG